jgi:hypothetical protein
MRVLLVAAARAAALPGGALAKKSEAPKAQEKTEAGAAKAEPKKLSCAIEEWGMKCKTPEGWQPVARGPNSLHFTQGGKEPSEGGAISLVVTAEGDLDTALKNVLTPFGAALTQRGKGAALPLDGKKARAETYEGKGKDGKILVRVFAVTNPDKGTSAAVFGFAPEAGFPEVEKGVDALGKSVALGDIIMNVGAMGAILGEWKKTAGEGETKAIEFLRDGGYKRAAGKKSFTGRFAIVGGILVLRESSGETLHIPIAAESDTKLMLGKMAFTRVGDPPAKEKGAAKSEEKAPKK